MSIEPSFNTLDPSYFQSPVESTGYLSATHNCNPEQMVDALTQILPLDDNKSIEIAQFNQRFRVKLTENDIDRQLERRIKLLNQFDLPKFRPTSEQQFEDWIDASAVIITKNQICVSIFQDAWSSVAPPALARHIGSIPICKEHEQLVNQVASLLFKSPTYVRSFEVSLLSPPRYQTVFEARIALEDTIARYYRLCKRWTHPFHLSGIRCIELALQSLPTLLEEDIRAFYDEPSWDQIWHRAETREKRLLLTNNVLMALPVFNNPLLETSTDADMTQPEPVQQRKQRRPPSPCPICDGDHWKSQCTQRPLPRCFTCGQVGHKSPSCTNIAVKDSKGRVDILVEPKPSQTIIHQRKDRTQTDKMLTAEGTIQALREVAEQKSEKSKSRRQNKRTAEGKPTRPRVTHPVALSQLEPSDFEYESDDSGDESASDGVDNVQLLSSTATHEYSNQVVIVPSTINTHKRPLILDTGAAKALANQQFAEELGLQFDENKAERYFAGLGNLKGLPTHPVDITIGDRTRSISFYVVNKPELLLLIGKSDLAQYNILIDPLTSNLIDRDTYEIVALGVESHVQQPAVQPELDTITQKKLGASDAELFEDGKKTILEKTAHLPPATTAYLGTVCKIQRRLVATQTRCCQRTQSSLSI